MTARLATSALRNGIGLRDPHGTVVVHSDRGSQFRSRDFVRTLHDAAMESFFSLLQKNVLDRQRWQNRDELRLAITIWIERTYHRRRRLGRLTPIEFKLLATPTQAA
jgi:transposase InsO family protein